MNGAQTRTSSRASCCQRDRASEQELAWLGQHALDDPGATLPAEVPDALVSAILASRRAC